VNDIFTVLGIITVTLGVLALLINVVGIASRQKRVNQLRADNRDLRSKLHRAMQVNAALVRQMAHERAERRKTP
jgi:hypothetical protein